MRGYRDQASREALAALLVGAVLRSGDWGADAVRQAIERALDQLFAEVT